jgi:glycosyltransferase involved in cell wall biosynthesis
MKIPEISVIVPTYNCGQYIGEAIMSILNQTLRADEIIVVDDGSTDTTQEVVSVIKDARIIYIRKENAGVSSARNVGLAKAAGKYIAFLDADDLWDPRMLELQSKILNKHPGIDLVISNFNRFDHVTGEVLPDQFKFYPELLHINKKICTETGAYIIQEDAFCTIVAFDEIPAYTQAIMFRKEVLANSLFNINLRICQDLEFVLKICTKARVAFNPVILAHVRRHTSNATRDISAMPNFKLKAFLALKTTQPLDTQRALALNDRLIRAYINLSFAFITMGSNLSAWKTIIESLSVKGSIVRKIKGFIKMALYFLFKWPKSL